MWARPTEWPNSWVATPWYWATFTSSKDTAWPFSTVQLSVIRVVASSPNSGEEMPRTLGPTPKKFSITDPSASKMTWIPPPLKVPMTSPALLPSMSGRPTLAKSPSTAARSEEVGMLDQSVKPFLTTAAPAALSKVTWAG